MLFVNDNSRLRRHAAATLPSLLALIAGLGTASSAHAIYGGGLAPKGAWDAAVYFQ